MNTVKHWLRVCALVLWLVAAKSAMGQTVTKLYDDVDGTHYNVTHTVSGTATTQTPGLGAYLLTLFEESTQLNHIYIGQWAWPGLVGSAQINTNFVVPPGKGYKLRIALWIYNTDDGGASSNWGIDWQYGFTGTAGSGPPISPGDVTVSLQNTSGVPITYRLMNGTTQIGNDVTLQPGQSFTETFTLPAGVAAGDLKVVSRIADISFTDGQWVVEEGAITQQTVVNPGVITVNNIHPANQTPTPTQIVPVPMPNAPASPPNGSGSGGTVWNSGGGSGATDGLTNTVFREGVDKITSRQDKQTAELKKLTKQADDVKALADERPTTVTMGQAGTSAKNEANATFDGLPTPASKTPSKSAPTFVVSNPLFGTVDMNPFTETRFGPIAAWFKSAFSWMLAVLFAAAVAKEAATTIRGVSAAQQAKGNPVLAGTGAQATALAAAGIMTALIVASIVAIIALAVSDFGFGTLTSIFSQNPFDSMPEKVAWCLDQVMNLGHVTLYLLSLPTLPLLFAKLYAATAAAVRFVVP